MGLNLDKRRQRALSAAALLVVLAMAAPAQAYWLKVRRKGPTAIVNAARTALVSGPQFWQYTVPKGQQLAGHRLDICRRPQKGGGSDVSVRLVDKTGGLVAAIALIDKKLTVRHAGAKPQQDHKALFTPVKPIGVPLILWTTLELTSKYRIRLEGEFQGTALLRMTPDYTSAKGLQSMKLGVSKRTLLPTVVEVVDLKGKPTSRLLWTQVEKRGGRTVAAGLRLRTMRAKKPLDFVLTRYVHGDKAPVRFGRSALSPR
ncbi:MAG: hypothetical protein KC502_03590 [Myxococcales bacterium]|nr:hypothetical protein [Myxococcales bacterium]